jgi:hypothetical protein
VAVERTSAEGIHRMSEKTPESPWSALSKAPTPGGDILVVRACASCKQGSTIEKAPDGKCRLCGASFDPEPTAPPAGPDLSARLRPRRSRFETCPHCTADDIARSHDLDTCRGCGLVFTFDPETDRWTPGPVDEEARARAYRSLGLRPPPPITNSD